MPSVEIKSSNIVTIEFRQEEGDKDYGSCLWAAFHFDLDRYDLTITSDCGNYFYGWTPTRKSESFMHLMARLDEGYLLYKLSDTCVIDEKATFEEVQRFIEDYGVDVNYSPLDMDEVKRACSCDSERDVHDLLKAVFIGSKMEDCDDYELWGCIQKDYPANAKRVAEIFMKYIRPRCKELSEQEASQNG